MSPQEEVTKSPLLPHPKAHDWSDEPDHHPHVVPMSILLGVFGALIFFTFITVAVTWVDLGPLNIFIAMFIAAIKGGLVALYFMHLRYDNPFNGTILLTALLFLALFIGIVLIDTKAYQPLLEAPKPMESNSH